MKRRTDCNLIASMTGYLKRNGEGGNKKRNGYNTDAILSTEFPVFHEDFSGRSGWRRRGCTYNADSEIVHVELLLYKSGKSCDRWIFANCIAPWSSNFCQIFHFNHSDIIIRDIYFVRKYIVQDNEKSWDYIYQNVISILLIDLNL